MDLHVDEPRDLPQRTFNFAHAVRKFVNRLPRVLSNYEDARQVVRSSGSVAANYVEAQEAVSRKDFFYRIKLCRKGGPGVVALVAVAGNRWSGRSRSGAGSTHP